MASRSFLVVLTLLAVVRAAAVPHVNFENHPIRALDLSPDGTLLAVAHTADHRVQLFDVRAGRPVFAGHVPVGIDPVAVRFRTDEELWVVNHISDSVSVIDVPSRRVMATLKTLDEPFDVVFAGSPERAWVSCSQANAVQLFNPSNRDAAPVTIPIDAEDPRSLAVSPDGLTVYAAIFESGNATTVLAGATTHGDFPPNVVTLADGPYAGVTPPPNAGAGFSPPLNPALPAPPPTALIVRRDEAGRWLDDNGGDWTRFVSGASAGRSGRVSGWDLADRDIAVIDTASRSVSYVRGLMNIGMALAVNPATGELTLVGTEATNEVRFEPNLTGTFVRVLLARVGPGGGVRDRLDLNAHLDYQGPRVSRSLRERSLGDPRGIAWRRDGTRGYVTGMGSGTVIAIDASGARLAELDVGEGPTGVVLSADETHLYVWNHFEATLSTIESDMLEEVDRLAAYDPLPGAISAGRRHFYGTQETSGHGQAACASCHVDARTDRLAWDLGDPSGAVKDFNQNCSTLLVSRCEDFHPLKGPMTTQTMQDIIGKEPLHWRGDRDGLEEFADAFVNLQGANEPLGPGEMQEFEDFLATVTLPPNPYRNLDNSLSRAVPLEGQFTSGRFGTAGQPLGVGDAVAGIGLFRAGELDLLPEFPNAIAECGGCHAAPTGSFVNGRNFDARTGGAIGGAELPPGPNGENHLGLLGSTPLNGRTMKIPQLRTLYDKVGFDLQDRRSRSGFGFFHDGTVDTLANLASLAEFDVSSDQEVADLIAFLLSFSGSDLPTTSSAYRVAPPASNDAHAAVGAQATLDGDVASARLDALLRIADSGAVELVAHAGDAGWLYLGDGELLPDDGGPSVALLEAADEHGPITFTAVPAGLGERLGLDRDGDGVANRVELAQGSDPADATSSTFVPRQGLWFNPDRPGHGIDLQRSGDLLAATWYSYGDDGEPTWLQAVGPYVGTAWEGELLSYRWSGDEAVGTVVGTVSFGFSDAARAEFCWELGDSSGCEPFERFRFSTERPLRNYTGLWFDPSESGYGLSIDTLGDVRVAVVYFYDADGDPRWVIGQGDNGLVGTLDMLSFQGFCPACDAVATTAQGGGTLALRFPASRRSARMDLDVAYPGLAGSTWQRTDVELVPLTAAPINLER